MMIAMQIQHSLGRCLTEPETSQRSAGRQKTEITLKSPHLLGRFSAICAALLQIKNEVISTTPLGKGQDH